LLNRGKSKIFVALACSDLRSATAGAFAIAAARWQADLKTSLPTLQGCYAIS
jgi:hypothetical protein